MYQTYKNALITYLANSYYYKYQTNDNTLSKLHRINLGSTYQSSFQKLLHRVHSYLSRNFLSTSKKVL